jgi:hypothetical protein
MQECDQPIKIGSRIRHPESVSLAAGCLDQYGIPVAGNVDRLSSVNIGGYNSTLSDYLTE